MTLNYTPCPAPETIGQQTYLLSKSIAANEFEYGTEGDLHFGPLLSLPVGAEIECCGRGFNDRTVKIRWHGKCYFAFREELAMQREGLKTFACGSA